MSLIVSLLSTLLVLGVPAPQAASVSHQYADSAHLSTLGSDTYIHANDARPLNQVSILMAKEHNWILDYEDPPYQSLPELAEIQTPDEWRAAHGGKAFKAIIGGAFDADLGTNIDPSQSNATQVINRMVAAYNGTTNPGHFEVRGGENGRIAIVGVATRNAQGVLVPYPPLLDTTIQLTPKPQTQMDALQDVASQLTKLSGRTVTVGTVPMNLIARTLCIPPAEPKSARSELAAILDASPVRLAYSLRYDSNDDLYAINLMGVGSYETDLHGFKHFIPRTH
jgi:hypothetical protein